MLAQTKEYFAGTAIASYIASDGDRQTFMPQVVAFGETRIGNQVFNFSVFFPFRGKASIDSANETLINWLSAVRVAN
jgi:hypothetical protein